MRSKYYRYLRYDPSPFMTTPSQWKTYMEINQRYEISVYACAYELYAVSMIDDSLYDCLSLYVNKEYMTGIPDGHDGFFYTNYDASSGMWINKHPNLDEIKEITIQLLTGEPYVRSNSNEG